MGDRPVFWFDFNSPFVYLAVHRIDALLPHAEWRPFAYPFLLERRGRLEEAAARDPAVSLAAAAPRAEALGLPFNPPEGLPHSTWSLPPLRAAVFADERGRLKEFTRAAFEKVFAEGVSLTDPGNVLAAAREAGLEPAEVAEAVERPEVKQRVKDNTEAAYERGVNGIPTFEVAGELVWGDDRLEEAAELLRRL